MASNHAEEVKDEVSLNFLQLQISLKYTKNHENLTYCPNS